MYSRVWPEDGAVADTSIHFPNCCRFKFLFTFIIKFFNYGL